MSEEEEVIVIPPKKKTGNKVSRWFKTRTGQTVIGVLAGAIALKVPGGQEAVQSIIGSAAPSDIESFANGMSIAAILNGIARMRSA